ncbi:zinc-ribbon domain-containing protein [[Eubacterium] cellulosolvens]
MVYCSKCGQKNPEDARFCNRCGATLGGPPTDYQRGMDKECEDECSGKRHSHTWTYFWITILVIIAAGLVFSLFLHVFKKELPSWMAGFDFWEICPLLVGIVIVIFILSAIIRTSYRR